MKKQKAALKTCTKCQGEFAPGAFYRNYAHCKACHDAYQKAYREAHREEIKAKRRGTNYNQKWMHTHMSTSAVLGLPQFVCPGCGVPKGKRAYTEGSPLCRACRQKAAQDVA